MTYRYNGSGNYISGIPARDLTDDEFNALPESQQKAVKKSGLYSTDNKVSQKAEVKDAPAQ